MIINTAYPTSAKPDTKPANGGSSKVSAPDACFHCGTPLRGAVISEHQKSFCCRGCLTVFELLSANGLTDYYRLGDSAGSRPGIKPKLEEFDYVNDPVVRDRLVDFTDDRITRVTFRIESIHCIACVWLLENLFQLDSGISRSEVNFPRKQISITFENARSKLGEVVTLLTSLGYSPELKLADLDQPARKPVSRRLWLQLGVAGFAFGNIMLLSLSSYFGLDRFSGPSLNRLFGYASLLLSLPVLFFSAADYWRAAWLAVRQRVLTIDVPIALGIAALSLWSAGDVFAGRGLGYFDSLAGLLFFLLCGRVFQQRTYDRLAFDRDYKSFFPLSVSRKSGEDEERVSLVQLKVGDRLAIRNGELIPADGRLVTGAAVIDYSFVTGESEPVSKSAGDRLYAGGRQIGGAIEVEMLKAVSQSHLTSLWNQQAFKKEKAPALGALTNRYSQRFTRIVLAIAIGAAIYWAIFDPSRALVSFVSVLIVACPCALALAAPFTLGTSLRVLGNRNVFLKNPGVVETLANLNTIVFDKTGTLTAAGSVLFLGEPLSAADTRSVFSLTHHSVHPFSVRIGNFLAGDFAVETVSDFTEAPGAGIRGSAGPHRLVLGSKAWLAANGITVSLPSTVSGSTVHLAIDGRYRGCFQLGSELRDHTQVLIQKLSADYSLALLSGDNAKERERFETLFGRSAHLHFNQSPLNKLEFIRDLQSSGSKVLMVGDGLNDAGALQQSDAGVAVVESMSAFSPASDAIMSASMVPRLHQVLRFAKDSVRVVRLSFLISSIYNVLGVSIAVRGQLSPLVCAILMPLSSVTVVSFACGLTNWFGRKIDREIAPDNSFNHRNQP